MPAIKQRDINARFARLEERVFRIELRLGPETAPATIAPSTEPADAAAIAPALDQPAAAETLPSHLLERRRSHAVPPPLPIRAEISPVPEPMTPAIAPSEPETPEVESAPELLAIPYAAPSPATPAVQGALERTIGLKWAGWAGAVVLVIGAALGVKFVYDQHWFGEVPPAVWLSSIFVAGLGLIGVGEVIYRRVHAIPAASVFGAGVATLFLAGYVGHAYYNLYTPGTALFLMAAAALVGALVAMRGNLVCGPLPRRRQRRTHAGGKSQRASGVLPDLSPGPADSRPAPGELGPWKKVVDPSRSLPGNHRALGHRRGPAARARVAGSSLLRYLRRPLSGRVDLFGHAPAR